MFISKSRNSIAHITMATLLGTSTMLASNLVQAGDDALGAIYLGAAYGYSRVDNEDFKDNNSVLKAFAGIKVLNFIGLEAAINDFGTSKGTGTSSELTGNTLAIAGFLPISDQFNIFAKVGNLWWENKISVLDTFNDTLSGNESFFGVGANLAVSDSLAIRFELERYDVKLSKSEVGTSFDRTFDLDVASVGISFSL